MGGTTVGIDVAIGISVALGTGAGDAVDVAVGGTAVGVSTAEPLQADSKTARTKTVTSRNLMPQS